MYVLKLISFYIFNILLPILLFFFYFQQQPHPDLIKVSMIAKRERIFHAIAEHLWITNLYSGCCFHYGTIP